MTLMHMFDYMIKHAAMCYNHIYVKQREVGPFIGELVMAQMKARIQALNDAKNMVYRYDLRFHPRC